MLKKLIIALCVMALILLAACKQDNTPSSNTTPNTDNVQSDTQVTTSGTELEEDVFDNGDITNTPNGDNSSNGNLSSNESSSGNNVSSGEASDSETSSEENTTSDSDNNQSDVVIDDDGTIKLPIDRFN